MRRRRKREEERGARRQYSIFVRDDGKVRYGGHCYSSWHRTREHRASPPLRPTKTPIRVYSRQHFLFGNLKNRTCEERRARARVVCVLRRYSGKTLDDAQASPDDPQVVGCGGRSPSPPPRKRGEHSRPKREKSLVEASMKKHEKEAKSQEKKTDVIRFCAECRVPRPATTSSHPVLRPQAEGTHTSINTRTCPSPS